MLKIGEFAQVGQVSIATLRYYDRYGLLKPSALDAETGYRYYALEQLTDLNRILALKDLGFALDQIAQLLEDDLSWEQLQGMFKLKQAQIQQVIEQEQARLAHLVARLRQLEQEKTMPTYDVLLKQVEPLLVASVRKRVPLISEQARLYTILTDYLVEQRVQSIQPSLVLLHSRHTVDDEGMSIDIEVAIPIPALLPGNEQVSVRILPGGLLACTVHRVQSPTSGAMNGHEVRHSLPHSNGLATPNSFPDYTLGRAYVALHRWIEENGYRITGPVRQLQLQSSKNIDPNKYITEVQFQVEK